VDIPAASSWDAVPSGLEAADAVLRQYLRSNLTRRILAIVQRTKLLSSWASLSN